MRRRLYVCTSILTVLVVAGSLFFFAERRRTPDWLQALYAQQPGVQVVQLDWAQQPENFRQEAGYRVASYSRFQYQFSDETSQYVTARLALPHPPLDVGCVLANRANREQAFFVNFYTDNLWNQAWIIYAGPTRTVGGKFEAQLAETLARLGCDLTL